MKAIISIAARMASTRLLGKSMAEVAGKPILQHLVERLSRANAQVVISNNGSDHDIRELAARLGVFCVWPFPDASAPCDVMKIHWRAMTQTDADILCIAGADDPLLDPALFDMVIDRLSKGDVAYVRTAGWPLGMNVWGVTRDAMEAANRLATAPDERQHVVPFFERRPNTYLQAVIRRPGADLYDKYRLTVDNPSDLELIRRIYAAMPADPNPDLPVDAQWVIWTLDAHPEWARINADGLQGTAARDAIYPDLTPVDEPGWRVGETITIPQPFGTSIDAIRRHVLTERQAALAAVPERGSFAEGQAAAMLSMDQWLQYKGDL